MQKETWMDKIEWIAIFVIIVITSLLIGNINNDNTQIINLFVSILFFEYIIRHHFIKKEKIIENRFDLLILLFCLTPMIPIIFGRYESLSDAIIYIPKYMMCFFFYILSKHMTKNEKNRNRILVGIIILIVLQTAFGIDKMSTRFFTEMTAQLGISETSYEEVRLNSVYDYANTYAIIAAVSFLLALYQLTKESKYYKKSFYAIAIFILEVGILLSTSRMVLMLLIPFYIAFIIALKNKEKIIKILLTTIYTGILAILYTTKYMNILAEGDFIAIWVGLFMLCFIIGLIQILLEKTTKKIALISTKILVGGSIGIIILGIVILWFVMKKTDSLTMFQSYTANKEVVREIYNVESNYMYTFEFDLIAKNVYSEIEIFEIEIVEKNKYFDDTHRTKINFSEYEGKKEISIHTQEDTEQMFIYFRTSYASDKTLLEIKSCFINGEEYILNYRYVPYSLVSKLKNINLGTKSAWERFAFIGDGIKLLKENWLLGVGGGNWKYHYGEVQSYNYQTTQVHSYPVQLWLEFGIIAFVSFIGILIWLLYTIWKTKKKEIFYIVLPFILLLAHSMIDFDFSFTYTLMLFFLWLGILGNEITNATLKRNWDRWLIPLTIMMIAFSSITTYVEIGVRRNTKKIAEVETTREEYQVIQKQTNLYKKLAPYHIKNRYISIWLNAKGETKEQRQTIIEEINYLMKQESGYFIEQYLYSSIDIYLKEYEENPEEQLENMLSLENTLIKGKIIQPYDVDYLKERDYTIITIAKKIEQKAIEQQDKNLQEIANHLAKKLIEEYEGKINNVSNYQICRYPKGKKESMKKQITRIYEMANQIIEENKG